MSCCIEPLRQRSHADRYNCSKRSGEDTTRYAYEAELSLRKVRSVNLLHHATTC